MTEPKLTEAQVRAIREARKNHGIYHIGCMNRTWNALQSRRMAEWGWHRVDGAMTHCWKLTPAGWAVEVGDE